MGDFVVEPLRAAIFALAHFLGGSLGAGIVSLSALLRLAILPLTIRLARRQYAQQQILQGLQPEITALQLRHKQDPMKLWQAMQALYARAGYRPIDPTSMLGGLVRLPIVSALLAALRTLGEGRSFAWILDLSKPNFALALLVTATSGIAGYLGAAPGAASTKLFYPMMALGIGVGLVVFAHMSSTLVLAWGANATVDLVQAAVLRRERRSPACAARR